MKNAIKLPRLYPILDAGQFPGRDAMLLTAEELIAGGATLLQYRNKNATSRQILEDARELKKRVGASVRLVMNDRADLCVAAEFDGLHVGQEDLSPEGARRVIGLDCWLGVSTHNPEQLKEGDATTADYLAIGPVFATSSKDRSGSRGRSGRRAARTSIDAQATGCDRGNHPGERLRRDSGGRGFGGGDI